MKKALFVLVKDFRRYAWGWAILIVLSILSVFLYGTGLGIQGSALSHSLAFLAGTVGFLIAFVLIVLVVQEEPLSDPDAYWLTRPIPRRQVLLAKLIFCTIVVAGIPAIAKACILLMNEGGHRVPYALAGLFGSMIWVLFQMYLSAQTRSLPRYLVLAVGLVIGVIVLQFMLFFVMPDGILRIIELGALPGDLGAQYIAWIQSFYWIAVALGLLLLLFQTRRRWLTWCLLFPAALGGLILTPSDDWFLTSDTHIQAELEDKHLKRHGTHSSGGISHAVYRARATLEHVPDGADIWVSVRTANLYTTNRDIEVSAPMTSQRARRTGSNDGAPVYEFDVFQIREDALDLWEEEEGRLSLSLYVTASTQLEHRRLPLEDGAGFADSGNRIRMQGMSRTRDELRVTFGSYIPGFFLEPAVPGGYFESFGGLYSFALADESNGMVYEGRHSSSHFGSGARQTTDILFNVPADSKEEDLQLIVYRREIIDSTFSFMNESGITLER